MMLLQAIKKLHMQCLIFVIELAFNCKEPRIKGARKTFDRAACASPFIVATCLSWLSLSS